MLVWLTDVGHRNVYLDQSGKVGKTFFSFLDSLDICTDILLGISGTQYIA